MAKAKKITKPIPAPALTIIVFTDRCWGKGKTLEEARRNASKNGKCKIGVTYNIGVTTDHNFCFTECGNYQIKAGCWVSWL